VIPVIFLHGFPHDHRLWAPQLAALGSQAQCLAPDIRNCPPFSMDTYADDVFTLMDTQHIDTAVIAGLSMAGSIALTCWRRRPDRIRALMLVAARTTPYTPEEADRRKALAASIRREGMPAIAASQALSQLGATTRTTHPELVAQVTSMIAAVPPQQAVGQLEAMLTRPDPTPILATITVPTLVIGGAEDPMLTPTDLAATADAIPNSRLELVAAAGHLVNLERPAAFNHITAEFLATL
jgi:3-oxoadipate enol-lactonase